MGRARAIGFALAVLVASSDPAVAPLRAISERATDREAAPCASHSPAEIAFACAPGAPDWLGASILANDPLLPRPADAFGVTSSARVAERLAGSDLARVPEATPLLALALGVATLAIARRRAHHSG